MPFGFFGFPGAFPFAFPGAFPFGFPGAFPFGFPGAFPFGFAGFPATVGGGAFGVIPSAAVATTPVPAFI